MLVIRFFRIGKKNQPAFKIIVTDKRKPPRGGRFVEELGSWNPLTKKKTFKKERIEYWLSVGANPSDSIYNLLIKEKILKGKKIPLHKKGKNKEENKTEEPKKEIQPEKEKEKKEEPKLENENKEKPEVKD